MNDWSFSLESSNSVDVVYLDLRKAFDCVPHRQLLTKFQSYSIILTGKLLNWIEDFLADRKQIVSLRGSLSDWVNITNGSDFRPTEFASVL